MKTFARPFPEDAEAEFAARTLARQSYIDFITYTYPDYLPEEFHIDLANNLEQVITGEIRNLMIFAPPQHGKSEAVSVRFPPYWLSKFPKIPVMLCSYGASLANEKAGMASSVLHSDTYRLLFPDMFKQSPKWSRRKWMAKSYNTRIYSAGVRGAITGRGAGLGIIDDPVKSWEEAYSSGQRDAVWDWFRTTFRTRLWEGHRLILIMTRWHEDDLAGRLLNESKEDWKVIRYPAISETQEERDKIAELQGLPTGEPDPLGRAPNEPLCPIRFSLRTLSTLKEAVGSLGWYAEYQGFPQAPGGNMFKREWFKFIRNAPIKARRIRYWDKAATQGGGARSAGVLLAYTPERLWYVEDVVKGQWSPLNREKVIKQVTVLDSQNYGGSVITVVEEEGGSGGKESAENTIRNLAGYTVYSERATVSKAVRAMPFSAQCEAGNVYLVEGAWNREYIDEIIMFPNGTFKDQVDATVGAFNRMLKAGWSR